MSNLAQLRKAMHEVENLERLESGIAAALGEPETEPEIEPSPGGDKPADAPAEQPADPVPADPSPAGDKSPEPVAARAAMTFEFPARHTDHHRDIHRAVTVPSFGAIVADLDRAYNAQRAKVRDLETEHTLAVAKLESDFRRKAEDLTHEANEAMRALESKHEKAIAAETAALDALRKLRG